MKPPKPKPANTLEDKQTGIAIRFIEQFDPQECNRVTDEDVRTFQEFAAARLKRLGVH